MKYKETYMCKHKNKHTHKNSKTKRKHKYYIHKKIHTQDTHAPTYTHATCTVFKHLAMLHTTLRHCTPANG